MRKQNGAKWVAVPGVGDGAYFYDNMAATDLRFAEVYARSGPHVVTVQKSVRQGAS